MAPVHMLVPGTEVSLDVMPGVELLPAGSAFLDTDGERSVIVLAGQMAKDMEEDDLWMQTFPHRVERFTIDGAQATLYRRTRAEDGGGYDGWWLCVHDGAFSVTVQANYTGPYPGAFVELEKVVRSVRWTGSTVQPDVALGYVLTSPDATPRRELAIGAMRYFVQSEASELELTISALPVNSRQAGRLIKGCADGTMAGQVVAGPFVETRDKIEVCWGLTQLPFAKEPSYVAYVQTAEGGLLSAHGKSKSAWNEAAGRQLTAVLKTVARTR